MPPTLTWLQCKGSRWHLVTAHALGYAWLARTHYSSDSDGQTFEAIIFLQGKAFVRLFVQAGAKAEGAGDHWRAAVSLPVLSNVNEMDDAP